MATTCRQSCLLYGLCFALLLVLPRTNASATGWNYAKESDSGPLGWANLYPDCNGTKQSPIDIETDIVEVDPQLEFFQLANYSLTDGVQLSLKNVGGHTAEVIYSGSPIIVSGGSLPGPYQVDQFHFHWGKDDSIGSEHAVNGKHSSMEMHIVHHQVALGDISTAMSQPDGLAVIGLFLEVSTEDNPALEPLLSHFADISKAGHSVALAAGSFKLSDFVTDLDSLAFYRYKGSLTTPPCSETVIWSLAINHLSISENQLNKFRGLYDSESAPLVNDFRPLQNRNDRKITKTSGGPGVHATYNLLSLLGPSILACLALINHNNGLYF